jgi:hypothetical protein
LGRAEVAEPEAIARLEAVFLPLLRAAEQEFAARYGAFRFSVLSKPVSEAFGPHGHEIRLECFPLNGSKSGNEPWVVLAIEALRLDSMPVFCGAGVFRGADALDSALRGLLLLTEKTLQDVAAKVPRLLATVERELRAWPATRHDA